MAQFYASIQGNRGQATRMGTKNSGIQGHIRGWDVGVEVHCRYNETTGGDEIWVYLTGGSNGGRSARDLVTILEQSGGEARVIHHLGEGIKMAHFDAEG